MDCDLVCGLSLFWCLSFGLCLLSKLSLFFDFGLVFEFEFRFWGFFYLGFSGVEFKTGFCFGLGFWIGWVWFGIGVR